MPGQYFRTIKTQAQKMAVNAFYKTYLTVVERCKLDITYEKKDFKLSTNIQEFIGDSLDEFEHILNVEDEFGLEPIPCDDHCRILTVGKAAEYARNAPRKK